MCSLYKVVLFLGVLSASFSVSAEVIEVTQAEIMAPRNKVVEVSQKIAALWGDSDILLTAEDHRDKAGRRLMAMAAVIALKPVEAKKCVFMEEGAENQPAYDLLPQNVQEAQTLHRQVFESQLPQLREIMGGEPGYHADFPALSYYTAGNFHVYATDMTFDPEYQKKLTLAFKDLSEKGETPFFKEFAVDRRNEAIVKNIKTLDDRCERSVGMFGAEHVRYTGKLKTGKDLPDLLQNQGYKVKTVLISACYKYMDCGQPQPGYDLIINIR